jgi:hypothetical protein
VEMNVKRLINDLLIQSGSKVSVEVDSYFPGGRLIGGKYSMSHHSITMYIEVIKEQCLQLFSSLEYIADYFAVVFAHELGHAEDPELAILAEQLDECRTEMERNQISLKIEENAWDFARELLPEMDHVFMDRIIFHSLLPYHDRLLQTEIA